MSFEVNLVYPDVIHIQDCMGVCMTLLVGADRALLVDAGYGVEDVSNFIRTLIGEKPLQVFLTHHHHDHTLGVRTLPGVAISMLADDMPAWEVYNGPEKRLAVMGQAQSKGLAVQADAFLSGTLPCPVPAMAEDIPLGGLTARIIPCPGHTPGSAAVLVLERRLLLTGDCWNPCTWAFFPEALGALEHRSNLRRLQALPFDHVLCSHQHQLFPRQMLDAFCEGLTDEALCAAPAVTMGGYEHIPTRQAQPAEGQIYVFDWHKAGL